MKIRWVSLMILSVFMLVSCSQKKDVKLEMPLEMPSQEILPTSSPNSPSQSNTTDANLSTPLPDGLQTLIEKAREDLAQQLPNAESKIKLVTAIKVTWPDSSLGCPQPGTAYTQALIDGFLIRLETDGELYEYHTNTNDVVFCENPEFPITPVAPSDIKDGQPWMPVEPVQPIPVTPLR